MNMQWEYYVVKLVAKSWYSWDADLDAKGLAAHLNRLGGEGWELVSVFDIKGYRGGTRFVNAVLKRPKP